MKEICPFQSKIDVLEELGLDANFFKECKSILKCRFPIKEDIEIFNMKEQYGGFQFAKDVYKNLPNCDKGGHLKRGIFNKTLSKLPEDIVISRGEIVIEKKK